MKSEKLKIKAAVKKLFAMFGYSIIPLPGKQIDEYSLPKKQIDDFPKDMEDEFRNIYEICKCYTLTSIERMYALYRAVRYVVDLKIPGDFVECGVWKGGSSMLMALTLLKRGEVNRKIYLYDTFEGMSKPTAKDKQASNGQSAFDTWDNINKASSPLNEVKANMLSVGYPETNIVFIKGKVEDTIPATMHNQISLLRLDTDWYESTYHELRHLFPLLSNKGVVIIDDYGHWTGAKEATDKYFSENKIYIYLNRIDYTGRLGIKYE